MITGRYMGRLGNNMFQYATCYALSRKTNYLLKMPLIKDFPNTSNVFGEKIYETEKKYKIPTKSGHMVDYSKIDLDAQQTFESDRFWENTYNFYDYKEEIKIIFDLPNFLDEDYKYFVQNHKKGIYENIKLEEPIGKNDLVISLRLGDFLKPIIKTNPPLRILLYSYFKIILNSIKYDRLFITSDEPFNPFVNEFRDHNPIIVENENAIKTMSFITKFNKIAISQSTYSWWAAFLSDAEEIYFPIPNNGPFSLKKELVTKDHYVRVHEPRYKYVHQSSGEIFDWIDAPGRRDIRDF
jgi:hypothetical protein